YLHGAPYTVAPTQQTHVPMLMWFSDAWQQQNVSQVACLKSQVNHSLSHDYLFPTLLSLLNIKTQVSDPENDMLHLCKPHPQLQHSAKSMHKLLLIEADFMIAESTQTL